MSSLTRRIQRSRGKLGSQLGVSNPKDASLLARQARETKRKAAKGIEL